MSASREKKSRQELNASGYVDPKVTRAAEEKAKARRSNLIYALIGVAFVPLPPSASFPTPTSLTAMPRRIPSTAKLLPPPT